MTNENKASIHEVDLTSIPIAYQVWPTGGNAWILTHDHVFVVQARLQKWEVVELFDKRQLLLVDGLPEQRVAELVQHTKDAMFKGHDVEDCLVTAVTTALHEAVSVSQAHDRKDADRWRAFVAASIRNELWVSAYGTLGRGKKPVARPIFDLNSFADNLITPTI